MWCAVNTPANSTRPGAARRRPRFTDNTDREGDLIAWFKVDDGLHASRKLLSIPRTVRLPALGLWTMAGSWSAHEELDGFIPSFMLKEWGGTPRLVRALVESGLWVPVEDGAQFHNWAEYQPTRAELDDNRERERVRKAEYRKKHNGGNVPAGHQVGHQTGHQVVSEHPDPTRPDPTPNTSSNEEVKRARPLPDAWKPSTAAEGYAAANGVDLTHEADQFRAHAHANGRTQKDWDSAFRGWLGNAKRWQKPARPSKDQQAHDILAMGARLQQQEIEQ